MSTPRRRWCDDCNGYHPLTPTSTQPAPAASGDGEDSPVPDELALLRELERVCRAWRDTSARNKPAVERDLSRAFDRLDAARRGIKSE